MCLVVLAYSSRSLQTIGSPVVHLSTFRCVPANTGRVAWAHDQPNGKQSDGIENRWFFSGVFLNPPIRRRMHSTFFARTIDFSLLSFSLLLSISPSIEVFSLMHLSQNDFFSSIYVFHLFFLAFSPKIIRHSKNVTLSCSTYTKKGGQTRKRLSAFRSYSNRITVVPPSPPKAAPSLFSDFFQITFFCCCFWLVWQLYSNLTAALL